jgi:hypothetical protein
VEIASLGPEERSYADIVEPGSRYFYRIRANSAAGESAYSMDAVARTGGRETNRVFRSLAGEDGSVCENSALANRGETVLRIGGGGDAVLVGDLRRNQQCKGIISFNTAALPDNAEIISAVLRLTQGSRNGNAFEALGPLYFDMSGRQGFGGSPTIGVGDFNAAAAGVQVASVNGGGGDNVYTIELDRRARSFINRTGRTSSGSTSERPTITTSPRKTSDSSAARRRGPAPDRPLRLSTAGGKTVDVSRFIERRVIVSEDMLRFAILKS